jgi:hypothetical protein
MDLERKGFIERIGSGSKAAELTHRGLVGDEGLVHDMGRSNYLLADPAGLLRSISWFRSMNELRLRSYSVSASSDRVIAELAKKEVVFCLGTAMERYTPYYRPGAVSLYIYPGREDDILGYLQTAKQGGTKVDCYRVDYVKPGMGRDMDGMLIDSLFARRQKQVGYTTMVQTVIDMFCDGAGVYAKPLLKKLWGIEI